jgi:hypothetical protein
MAAEYHLAPARAKQAEGVASQPGIDGTSLRVMVVRLIVSIDGGPVFFD